ncbi:MAG: hypothetical protein RBT63_01195 [Bdellovibrionales bacterium]|jgi:hypothetical protein|nr:hypothetical protein [Bdellovibrionales bacterium]
MRTEVKTEMRKQMKSILSFMMAVTFAVIFAPNMGATAPAANEKSAPAESASSANSKRKKSTEVSFDDVLVQGKYHFSDEAVTTVEDDKILDALLGVRTDFKDRIKKSTARH